MKYILATLMVILPLWVKASLPLNVSTDELVKHPEHSGVSCLIGKILLNYFNSKSITE